MLCSRCNQSVQGVSFANLFLAGACLGFFILGVFTIWRYRKSEEMIPRHLRSYNAEFHEKFIHFPNGYYFKQSSISNHYRITTDQIDEVNLFTYPPSIVINQNEIIFLGHEQKELLETFAKENNLEFRERFDIWEALNEVFLDTEFSEKEKQASIQKLVDNGLSISEIENIRKKIRWIMWRYTWSMEWVYLGQFDYLRLAFLTKKKYWRTMEIALRNFKK